MNTQQRTEIFQNEKNIMKFFSHLILVSTAFFLGTQSTYSSESSEASTSICIMHSPAEYTDSQWLDKFTSYVKLKGQQQQRLETDDSYTSSHVRFVQDIPKLTVGYGLLTTEEKPEIPGIKLPEETYLELAKVGIAVKVINGYVQTGDEFKQTFTPDKTNVFVPHISYIIQWTEDQLPELVPGRMLQDQDKTIVFMSGNGTEETATKIEQFYNHLYKNDENPTITILSGHKVAEDYVPYALHEAATKLEIFKDSYLGSLSENMRKRFPYTKAQNGKKLGNTQAAKNRINFTFQFLALLLNNKLKEVFDNRQDTVHRLLEDFLKDKAIKIAEEKSEDEKRTFKENSFLETLKKERNAFLEAALNRLKSELDNLDEADRNFLKGIIAYIRYSLNPKLLETLKESKKFWVAIKKLGDTILCTNPDSPYQNKISVAERLKKYALQGFNGSHTEQLFLKFIRTNPSLLIQGLQNAIEQHQENISDRFKPRFLGLIIDSFSWLDICSSCGHTLHHSSLWSDSLREIGKPIETTGFQLPFSHINSIFRMVSQEAYDSMPAELRGAEGGKDYTNTGWDYRLLSELRYTLATRFSKQKSTFLRDKTFERIPNCIMAACLTQPLGFWQKDHPLLSAIALAPQDREFSCNAIDILFLRFPNSKALHMKKIENVTKAKKVEEVYELSKKFATDDSVIVEEDEKSFFENLNFHSDLRYAKTYFGEACLKKAQRCFKKSQAIKGWKYMIKLIEVGFIKEQEEQELSADNPKKIAKNIITYWKNSGYGKRVSFNSPEAPDKENANNAVKILWKLAYKEKYSRSLQEDTIQALITILEKSKLSKPEFTT